MTDITTRAETRLRRLLAFAAQSREAIELEWEQERRERVEAQVRMAVRLADDQTRDAFPDTLARVVQASEWAGHPALYVDGIDHEWAIAPCAVTYLEEGVWLHHTPTAPPGNPPEPRWTLLVPCVCGDYRELNVCDDYLLARELQHADENRDVCLGDCTPSDLAPSADRLRHLAHGQDEVA